MPLRIGRPDDAFEQAANHAAEIATGVPVPANIGRGSAGVTEPHVQRQQPQQPTVNFKPVDDESGERELKRKVAEYVKKGKTQEQAVFLAMDDMFAERVKATGGRRLPGTATPGTPGTKTFLQVPPGISFEGKSLKPGFYNAAIDDETYNCHSFTFYGAKQTKLAKLQGLAQKIPKEGEELAGKDYFDAAQLIANGIHFEPHEIFLIYPRWVLDEEARTQLKGYKPVAVGGPVAKGDIAMYSKDGQLPHSAKVTEIDAHGRPTKVKGKWGHYSLFEHDPEAVPAHYGKPSYFRKA